MTKNINKTKVKKAFSKQAGQYDMFASLQREAADRLDFMLSLSENPPGTILDIGSGTGFLTSIAASRWKRSKIYCCDISHGMNLMASKKLDYDRIKFVTGDADDLPYKDRSFDLVISSLAYQWVHSMENAFNEVKRILAPRGLFIFSTFGRRTLQELHTSYMEALVEIRGSEPKHLHYFPAVHQLGDGLTTIGFDEVCVNVDRIKEHYSNPASLLKRLKTIGASNAISSLSDGLGGRQILKRAFEIYEDRFSDEKGVYATFEILNARGIA